MRKYARYIMLLVILSVMLNLLLPVQVSAMTETVVVSGAYTSYSFGSDRLSFSGEGYFVRFYQDGAHTYCKSMVLGNTSWVNQSADLGDSRLGLSVWWNGTYVYMVRSPSLGGRPTYFRRGYLEGNGTITWAAEQSVGNLASDGYTPTEIPEPEICIDGAGTYWIVYNYYDGPNGGDQVYAKTCSTGNETWVTDDTWNVITGVGYYIQAHVVPAGSGVVVFGAWGHEDQAIRARYWDGSAWAGVETLSAYLGGEEYASFLGDGSVVHIAYELNSGALKYCTFSPLTGDYSAVQDMAAVGYGPVLSKGTYDDTVWLYYYDNTKTIKYRVLDGFVWGDSQDLWTDEDGIYLTSLFVDTYTERFYQGCYWSTPSPGYDVKFVYLFNPSYSTPYGVTTAASDVGSFSATLNGHIISDGNRTTTVSFHYETCPTYDEWENPTCAAYDVTVGNYTSGEDASIEVTDLAPGNDYRYYMVLSNSLGNYTCNTIEFTTTTELTPDTPIVYTLPIHYADTYVLARGILLWDGNLDCVTGFQYKVHGGGGNWTEVYNYATTSATPTMQIHHSGEEFIKSLYTLTRYTNYDLRAFAKNSLGYGYGQTIIIGSGPQTAAPTPTPWNPILPWGVGSLGSNAKLIIAILGTIGAMVLVSGWTRAHKASLLVVFGVGFAAVIVFTVLGWYPIYVIILTGGIVALMVLLQIQRAGSPR